MIIKKFILITVSIVFLPDLHAQNAIAISSNPGPGLHIALIWTPSVHVSAYNIFRRTDADQNYPATPINPIPVKLLTDCPAIRSLLITSPDSTNWKLLARIVKNPCSMDTISKTSDNYERMAMLAKSNMPIAIAVGLGYKDNIVTNAKGYFYKIIALDAANRPISTVANDLHVVAGIFALVAPPTGVIAEAGDATVQIRWNKASGGEGYSIERSTNPAGPFVRVNENKYSSPVHHHLNGDTLIPSTEGSLDFQRYNETTGKPVSHIVKLLPVNGPLNGVPYYYRVRSLDFFDRAGSPSVVSNAVIPRDSTKPSVPLDLATTVDDNEGKVNIRWTQVVKDINGHWEQPDSSVAYSVYRFTSSGDPNSTPLKLVGIRGTHRGQLSRDISDADPALRAIYGNKTWWYRVRTIDVSGNTSQWSSAASAIVKDITAPAIVKQLTAEGFEDHITLKWQLNTEPDMAGYMIYRSLCHLGAWVECNSKDTSCRQWVNYNQKLSYEPPTNGAVAMVNKPGTKLPCPCSGAFVFLGEITQDSTKRAATAGNFFFDDKTIPAGSPLCYAYWIKAKDSSDNLSGSFPVPSAVERSQIVCLRLHDLTAPEPALISGLFAQADQIRVEWMGPPTQDTRAYHVYRADGTDPSKEPDTSIYKWVGGMTVELPPTLPKVLTSPYTRPETTTPCDRISVQATPWMSEGFFEDKDIKPKQTYWYRVVGIDYDGNQTTLDKAAPISTFSFTRKNIPAPVISMMIRQPDVCAVILQWSPAYDPADQSGFIVYRSSTESGSFTPIVVSPLKSNRFTDNAVVRGVTYWYKVALLMKNGRLSELTAAQSIRP